MDAERRRQWLLGGLALVLGAAAYRALPSPTASLVSESSGAADAPRTTRTSRTQAPAAAPAQGAPDVHLGALTGDRVKPVDAERNLFRFRIKAAPPPPPPAVRPATTPANAAPAGPAPVPPPPPIALKFIGLLDTGDQRPKVAILSDAAGHVFYGTEGGPPIEGRYRILKVGTESIEMSYLDGRGRQTLRLSGS